MVRQSYLDFVALFGEMNPFELSHLSESVFNKFDELHVDAHGEGSKMPFSLQDTEYVLIRAMRSVQLELAESKMDDAKAQLEKAKKLTFTPRRVTEEDEARVP
jgi:hypothetical protein